MLSKVRQWATQVPEIRVETEGRNPLISVQLSDVDYESVVDRARGEDNDGRRRELIKRLVAEGFGLDALGPQDMLGAHTHKVIWRGTAREVDLVFGNVRDAGWLTTSTSAPARRRGGSSSTTVRRPDLRLRGRIDQMRAGTGRAHHRVAAAVLQPAHARRQPPGDLNYLLDSAGDRCVLRRPPLRDRPGAGEDHPAVAAQALLHESGRPFRWPTRRSPLAAATRRVHGAVADAQLHAPALAAARSSRPTSTGAGGVLRHMSGAPAVEPGDEGCARASCRWRTVRRRWRPRAGAAGPDARRAPGANLLGVGKAAETPLPRGRQYFTAWGRSSSDGSAPTTPTPADQSPWARRG